MPCFSLISLYLLFCIATTEVCGREEEQYMKRKLCCHGVVNIGAASLVAHGPL
jgi:hypothetical protein